MQMPSIANVLVAGALGAALAIAPGGTPTPPGTVSGRLKVIDRGGQTATDLQQAVIWLTPVRGTPPVVAAARVDITTEKRTFSPHVAVVTVGSTVRFPNRDGFNHNVFSLTEGNAFDLGLYERGDGKSTQFNGVGVVNVFCNVHSTMSAVVVVRNTPWFAQPLSDGSFTIPNVPAGEYVLHTWHERAQEATQNVTVAAAGLELPALELDARSYVQREHLNKFGRPYARTGRRY
jgi:plastocyanin